MHNLRIFQKAPIGMAIVDPCGHFRYVNAALCNLLRRPAAELTRLSFQNVTHKNDLERDLMNVEALLRGGGGQYTMEKRYLSPCGASVWTNLDVSLVVDANGRADHFIATMRGAQTHVDERERLRNLAYTDPLTGLANRAALARVLDAAATATHPLGVLICDLDGLKPVNDRLGHAAGDALIATAARRLKKSLGPDAFAARVGGDEFFVAVRGGASVEELHRLAKRLRRAIETPLRICGKTLTPRISIGVALQGQHEAISDAMTRADADMYLRKSRAYARRCFRMARPAAAPMSAVG